MNVNLRNAIRNLAATYGTAALLDVRCADENLPVFAGKEPTLERQVFMQCLAAGLPAELQKNPDPRARAECKNRAVRKMTAQGYAAPLAQEVVDLVDSLVPANAGAVPGPRPTRESPAAPPPLQASVQNRETSGSVKRALSRKPLVFGIAGGLGAADGELLSEPIRVVFDHSFLTFWGTVLHTALWAAFISLGVSVGLLIAQNIYLKKMPRPASFAKTMLLGIASGAFAGGLAQVVFAYTSNISLIVEIISRVICWGVMACGVGFGVSLFIPNYPRKRAMLAGLLGGIIGGALFRASFDFLPEVVGRIFGVAILGVFIGLTISIVEEILREAWLTVVWARNETTTISLGAKPLVFGSSPEADVYLRRDKFPLVAAIVKIENAKVVLDNNLTGQRTEPADGSEITLGTVKIIVHIRKGVKRP
jgi:hypothetical protein